MNTRTAVVTFAAPVKKEATSSQELVATNSSDDSSEPRIQSSTQTPFAAALPARRRPYHDLLGTTRAQRWWCH